MLPPERIDRMQSDFARLLGGYGVAPPDAYPAFDRLVAAHSEPHRHYHTLEHLAEMFRVVGRLGGAPSVHLAVWFHDAVYDPRAHDNEERSADLAAELGSPDIDRVRRLILATKHTGTDPADDDTAVLLDADLAILGASEGRYGRYAADIRREYHFVPEADYVVGRVRVLEAFLNRERIYRTAIMRAEGDAAARRNLAAEIDELRAISSR